jgi:hypothetical protein
MAINSIQTKIKQLKSQSSDFVFIPFKNALQPYVALLAVSLLIYFNTLNNEVAFDDENVIHKNEYVIKGVSGIKDILLRDSYFSYYKQLGMESNLPGGRYRPLSHITFAIEQEFIGTIPDGIVNERSWDINSNGVTDQFEDTNKDGLFTDYDFWIRGAGFRHFVNVLLYAILILLIYRIFILYLFPNAKDMVFFCCLLFAVHPLHTEVVANIKSRDEILSLLFIVLTILFAYRYVETWQRKHVMYTSLFMFLALMSKEYALFLFGLLPIVFYVFQKDKISLKDTYLWLIIAMVALSSLIMVKLFNTGTLIAIPFLFLYGGYFLAKKSESGMVKIMYALGAALIAYLAFRFSATTHQVYNTESFKNDILGNPYLFATPEQEWASKIVVWYRYLKLFFIPHPLLVDYSFKSIPYSDFSQALVWITLLLFSALIALGIYGTLKRKKWSFGIVLFLLFFFPISNLVVDIGATMGERLLFHSSLGLCLLVSLIVFYFIKQFQLKGNKLAFLLLAVIGLQTITYAVLTIKRNPDWKNNNTLFTHDVKHVPENINVLLGAGTAYYEWGLLPENKNEKTVLLNKAINYYDKGISIYPTHFPFHINKAICFYNMDKLDSAIASTDICIKLAPKLPYIYNVRNKISDKIMANGIEVFQKGDQKKGLQLLVKSLSVNKNNVKAWNNMAKALFQLGAIDKAIACYKSTLKIDPQNQIALDGLDKITKLKNNNEQ